MDDETLGEGNSVFFKYRVQDVRTGRFYSIDPLAPEYPWNSVYAFSENDLIRAVELEGLEKATPQMQQNALNEIQKFSNNGTSGIWSNISKSAYVKDLTQNILDSRKIDQAGTNLCGVAAACKVMVDYDPKAYVKLAKSLYEEGHGPPNSLFSKGISVNQFILGKGPMNGLNNVDHVVMTSIRNSFNLVLDYSPEKDLGISGFTWPGDVKKLVENFSNVGDFSYKYDINPQGITKAISDNATPVALFDIKRLKTGKQDSNPLGSAFGNHYIIINSISQQGQNITMNYWNYGDFSATQSTITTDYFNFSLSLKKLYIFNYEKK